MHRKTVNIPEMCLLILHPLISEYAAHSRHKFMGMNYCFLESYIYIHTNCRPYKEVLVQNVDTQAQD